jgi:hypothetical protein
MGSENDELNHWDHHSGDYPLFFVSWLIFFGLAYGDLTWALDHCWHSKWVEGEIRYDMKLFVLTYWLSQFIVVFEWLVIENGTEFRANRHFFMKKECNANVKKLQYRCHMLFWTGMQFICFLYENYINK